jgi:hypothetical protein
MGISCENKKWPMSISFSARNQHAETLKSREQSMLNEYGCERIRRAYDLEKKNLYQIANEEGCCHQAIEKAHFGPLHYLPSLEHRQGTFDYVKPFKHWREEWLPCYSMQSLQSTLNTDSCESYRYRQRLKQERR